jgi:hypothetical protein
MDFNEQLRTHPGQCVRGSLKGIHLPTFDVHLDPIYTLKGKALYQIVDAYSWYRSAILGFLDLVKNRVVVLVPAYRTVVRPRSHRQYLAVGDSIQREIAFQLPTIPRIWFERHDTAGWPDCSCRGNRIRTDETPYVYENLAQPRLHPLHRLVVRDMEHVFERCFVFRTKPRLKRFTPQRFAAQRQRIMEPVPPAADPSLIGGPASIPNETVDQLVKVQSSRAANTSPSCFKKRLHEGIPMGDTISEGSHTHRVNQQPQEKKSRSVAFESQANAEPFVSTSAGWMLLPVM